jgi:hypothetical protein
MNDLIGRRIKCLGMVDDPCPVEYGQERTIVHVGGGIINVKWDNGRSLGLWEDIDKYQILPD